MKSFYTDFYTLLKERWGESDDSKNPSSTLSQYRDVEESTFRAIVDFREMAGIEQLVSQTARALQTSK